MQQTTQQEPKTQAGAHDSTMRDLFAVMADRRTVKQFSPRPVELDKIVQIIEAGTLAPSSGNIQNWTYTVVTDVDKIRAMYGVSLNQEPFLSAMTAIIVCGDAEIAHQMYGMRGKRLYTIQNCAAAIQNMLLASHALGLGATWIGAFDEDKIASMFNIPSHRHRPQAIILLGYPYAIPEPKDRKPLHTMIFFNTFGNKVLRPHLVLYDWATEWRELAKKIKTHKEHAVSSIAGFKERKEKLKEEQRKQNGSTKAPNSVHERLRSALDTFKREEYREK